MAAGKSILVVLASFFIAAECRSQPAGSNTLCVSAIEECSSFLMNNRLVAEALASGNHAQLVANIDEICTVYDETAHCLRLSMSECHPDLVRQVEATLSAGDYLCSDEARQILIEQQDNVCLTDPLKAYQLPVEIEFCAVESTASSGDYQPCTQDTLLRQCTLQVITRECGESVEQLASEVYDRLSPVISENCAAQGSGDLSRRFYDLYMKRFV